MTTAVMLLCSPTPPSLGPTDPRTTSTCTCRQILGSAFPRSFKSKRNVTPWISFFKIWFPGYHRRAQSPPTRWGATSPSEILMVRAAHLRVPSSPAARGKAESFQRAGLLLLPCPAQNHPPWDFLHAHYLRQVQESFFPPNATFFAQRSSGLLFRVARAHCPRAPPARRLRADLGACSGISRRVKGNSHAPHRTPDSGLRRP